MSVITFGTTCKFNYHSCHASTMDFLSSEEVEKVLSRPITKTALTHFGVAALKEVSKRLLLKPAQSGKRGAILKTDYVQILLDFVSFLKVYLAKLTLSEKATQALKPGDHSGLARTQAQEMTTAFETSNTSSQLVQSEATTNVGMGNVSDLKGYSIECDTQPTRETAGWWGFEAIDASQVQSGFLPRSTLLSSM